MIEDVLALRNPFFRDGWMVFRGPQRELLMWLVMSLNGQGVNFDLSRLRELPPERLTVAMQMLEWFYLYGPDDAEFRGLIHGIEVSATFNLFDCIRD